MPVHGYKADNFMRIRTAISGNNNIERESLDGLIVRCPTCQEGVRHEPRATAIRVTIP
jgi:hypothetical protein